ncbi:MAG: peroxide stress protein YaaA [Endozoicomonadaceae bacterium]|nr:peroxide stress protein YaaA [Endozoicomonadaceae bacterium]
MLILLSPAKKLDNRQSLKTDQATLPDFLNQSSQIIKTLKTLSFQSLKQLMQISDTLIELNMKRYQYWSQPFTLDNAKQAIFSFKGDVYIGFDADTLNSQQLHLAQKKIRILSGLYGVLRPLDLIQPYRLEMGTPLKILDYDNLYHFWRQDITNKIQMTANNQLIINLCSQEYFKVVNIHQLHNKIIHPIFKDFKNGTYKIISFYAKKARGLMARFIVDHDINSIEGLYDFNQHGYNYNAKQSSPNKPVFTRDKVPE